MQLCTTIKFEVYANFFLKQIVIFTNQYLVKEKPGLCTFLYRFIRYICRAFYGVIQTK